MDLVCKLTPALCVETQVSGLAEQEAKLARVFAVVPQDLNPASADLQFKEYAEVVARALTARGYTRSYDLKDTEIFVLLDYGRGSGRTVQNPSVTLPTYGFSSGGTARTTGTVGSTAFSATTTVAPVYGQVGTETFSSTSTIYERRITLRAVSVPELVKGNLRDVWRTEMVSVGSDADLRAVFPAMIAAGADSFGVRTPKAIKVQKRAGSKEVRSLTGEP